jgi:hypothetical protein
MASAPPAQLHPILVASGSLSSTLESADWLQPSSAIERDIHSLHFDGAQELRPIGLVTFSLRC